jgi:membrane-bound metal-dependent hydrolase YbcI (DUF457 family)
MPNRNFHQILGAVAGASFSVVKQCSQLKENPNREFDYFHLLACVSSAVVGAMCPDILEPANRIIGPHHRSSCHSLAAGTFMAKGISLVKELEIPEILKDTAICFSLGYLTHLAADLGTTKGLCVLHRRF